MNPTSPPTATRPHLSPTAGSPTASASAGLLLVSLLAAACQKSPEVVPVYQELELNDTPASANPMGVLGVGDRLLIEGVVGDPFVDIDGFSFVSAGPIHVDFQLFASRDLDVCLYDPALDATVACFATANDPERGGVDVFGGGLEFHLTVEACIEPGCFPAFGTPYTLELTVQHLFLASTESGSDAGSSDRALELAGSSVRGVEAEQEEGRQSPPRSPQRYKNPEPKDEAVPDLVLQTHTELFFDENTETTFLVEILGAHSPRGQ